MRNLKTKVFGLVLAGIVSCSSIIYASEGLTGSAAAIADQEYTLEEMLIYAIEDEYLAQAEYDKIMEQYGVQKPFSNIIQSEQTHINLLLPLFETYDVSVPVKAWEELVPLPATLTDSYQTGVMAEEKNIEMYESFLKQDLPEDVADVFEKLMNASKNHLKAFENVLNGSKNGRQSGRFAQ